MSEGKQEARAFSKWFDLWDQTHDQEVRRLCGIAWGAGYDEAAVVALASSIESARQANQPQPRKYVSLDTARLGQEPHFGCIEDADSTFCDDPKCWCAEPQGKAQPDSGEMGPSERTVALRHAYERGKKDGTKAMAEKAAQQIRELQDMLAQAVAHFKLNENPGRALAIWEEAAYCGQRSLASAEPQRCPTCNETGPRNPEVWARLCPDNWHYPNATEPPQGEAEKEGRT